jgi:hypothetical protein
MAKQQILADRGKRFDVVLEEQALRTWFGTAEVQAGQLGRLLEVMGLPGVSLGIIPMMTERTGVPSAPFWIFDDVLVALETTTAAIEVTQPEEIGAYVRMFGHVQQSAVYGPEARALIVKALDEMRLLAARGATARNSFACARRSPYPQTHGQAACRVPYRCRDLNRLRNSGLPGARRTVDAQPRLRKAGHLLSPRSPRPASRCG